MSGSITAILGGGSRPPRALTNAFSTTGYTTVSSISSGADASAKAKTVLSGALTANTLATVLNISGAGECNYLSISSVDATSRTMRMVVTIDGVVAFDSTSAATVTTGSGAVVLGTAAAVTNGAVGLEPTPFLTSFKVEIASSLSETDKIQVGYKLRTF